MSLTENRKNILEFFADVVLGTGAWHWKRNLDGKDVIATSDSIFADTWTVFTKDEAIKALKMLHEETGDKKCLESVRIIEKTKGIFCRNAIFNGLKFAVQRAEPELIKE